MHEGFLSGEFVDVLFVVVLLCHIMEFVIVLGQAVTRFWSLLSDI